MKKIKLKIQFISFFLILCYNGYSQITCDTILFYNNNAVDEFKKSNLISLDTISACSKDSGELIVLDNLKKTRILNLREKNIDKIKLKHFKKLEDIDLSSNSIDTIDLSENKELVNINLSDNKIRYLNYHQIKKLTYLESLDLSRNKLEKGGVNLYSSSLKKLILSENEDIDSIRLDSFPSLTRLECKECNLKYLNIPLNSKLEYLDLSNGSKKLIINGLKTTIKNKPEPKPNPSLWQKTIENTNIDKRNFNNSDTLGSIVLRDKRIRIFNSCDTNSSHNQDIDKIQFSILEGFLLDVKVFPSFSSKYKGYFTNTKSPVAIKLNRFYTDKLYFEGSDRLNDKKCYYINLSDVLDLNLLNNFIPDNEENRVLTEKGESINLFKNVGINNILDLRIYTDALALFGNESNGLIQTQLNYKQILHRKNFTNGGSFFLRILNLRFNYNRFDSSHQYADILNKNRISLIQKQSINFEASVSLFDGWLGKKSHHFWYLEPGLSAGISKVVIDSSISSLLNPYTFSELGVKLNAYSSISANINFRHIIQIPTETWQKEFTNFYRIGVELFWSPFKYDVENTNKLFGKVLFYGAYNNVIVNKPFFQLQMGYSMNIGSIFKK